MCVTHYNLLEFLDLNYQNGSNCSKSNEIFNLAWIKRSFFENSIFGKCTWPILPSFILQLNYVSNKLIEKHHNSCIFWIKVRAYVYVWVERERERERERESKNWKQYRRSIYCKPKWNVCPLDGHSRSFLVSIAVVVTILRHK